MSPVAMPEVEGLTISQEKVEKGPEVVEGEEENDDDEGENEEDPSTGGTLFSICSMHAHFFRS